MHEERSGHFAGLTKRNREYLFKIEKELTAQGYPAEKRTAAIKQMKNELQQRQREDQRRKKEYLRRANEACRMSLHLCWQAGGYIKCL